MTCPFYHFGWDIARVVLVLLMSRLDSRERVYLTQVHSAWWTWSENLISEFHIRCPSTKPYWLLIYCVCWGYWALTEPNELDYIYYTYMRKKYLFNHYALDQSWNLDFFLLIKEKILYWYCLLTCLFSFLFISIY